MKFGNLNFLEPSGPLQACNGTDLPYNRFKDGRTSVESDALSGRLSTSRNDELINQVRTLVTQDRRVTVRELAYEMGISIGSVHFILTHDLAMRRVSAKFMTTHQFIPRN